jgi:peptidoglycan/LPS O-acetylase OafA/YrhL
MSKQLNYLPKLDALRAIAALMVLFSHYFEELKGPVFSFGGNGVQIFFVISGFLITNILLSQKNNVQQPKIKLIRNFIVKRALRLFPVYYILLTVLFLMSIVGGLWICGKGDIWHYFTYTQNYLFFKKGWQTPLFNHTWSLAVEEQFYLFWPFLILLIPRKAELPVLIGVLLTGFLAKIYFIDFYSGPGTVKGITFLHFDTLGAGALLAYLHNYKKESILVFFEKIIDYLFIVTLAAALILTYNKINDSFFLPMLLMLMSFSLVFICSRNVKSVLDPLLELNILKRIGKISYGVYLYHKLIPFFFTFIYGKTGWPPIHNSVVLFILYFSITMVVATLSWKFLESPILRLKEKFDF